MTRINCLPVTELADQHLFAEYRELPRIFKLARKLSPREAVPSYRMGSGHVKFFYDKTLWLFNRHKELVNECVLRGYKLSYKSISPIPGLDLDWSPTPQAIHLSRTRLQEKLQLRPSFYKYHGKPVNLGFY